jgi:hypothetical protein
MLRSWWCLGLGIAALVGGAATAGCSQSTPGTSSDASTMADEGPAPGPACVPDASLVIPTTYVDGGTPLACVHCLQSKCAMELAACGAECVCNSSLSCLLMTNINYSSCQSTALAAISAGNAGLTAFQGCLPNQCNSECFPSMATDAGQSSNGGRADTGSSDARGQ